MVFTAPEESVLEQLSTKDIIDKILDECLLTQARRPIMKQFNPSGKYIWKQWTGTVFVETWKSMVRHALWCMLVYLVFLRYPRVKHFFSGLNFLYPQLLSITTFTLTFFVNESYSVWRKCLTTCRMLQGRLNDLGMALAGSASRRDDNEEDSSSVFTASSRKILLLVGRYIRLFNILYFAALARSHRPLLTPQGMRRMENRGLMTAKERQVIKRAPVPVTQRHNTVMMWVLRTVIDGRKAGHIDGGFGFEQQMMSKIQEVRSQSNSMESVLRGRMPFAYVHLVQVLIDTVLSLYPLMLFSKGVDVSFHLGICGSLMLTSSYQGLFDLAKQLLDPFHNENFWQGQDALVVNTLIAETNAGSMRWMYCLDEMPISYESIRKGKLDDFILPEEGFSREVADAASEEQKEQKRSERERKKLALQRSGTSEVVRESYAELVQELEAVQEELEKTRLILNAPPGSDFVPGLDEKNGTVAYNLEGAGENSDKRKNEESSRDKNLESFISAAEDEFGEAAIELIGIPNEAYSPNKTTTSRDSF